MQSNFVIWALRDVPNACCLDELIGVDDVWELREGVPRAVTFPRNAVYTMDQDFPHDTLLTDNLINTRTLIVASLKLKKFLETRQMQQVEYLPITILDHKGKPASHDYFIIHPINPVDCLDTGQCGAQWSSIDKETIQWLDRLVIDEGKIDPAREIFRLKFFYDVILVSRALAEAIDAEGFTGIRWIELGDYPEL